MKKSYTAQMNIVARYVVEKTKQYSNGGMVNENL
jgi:hypothetical protein